MKNPLLLCLSLLCLSSLASALSGEKIMQKVYDQSRLHKNQQSDVQMLIYKGSDGTKARKRRFQSKFRIFKDRSKSLIRLYSPPAQKGVGLLSETRDDRERSDQWIYLPVFRQVRKINSQSRNDSFLGSDLTISDMAGRKPEQDNHRLLEEDDTYWTVESRPKDTEDQYSRLVSRVHKKISVVVEVNFFDQDDKLLKTLTSKRIGKFAGMYMPVETVVKNARTGGYTELIRSDINVRARIGENEVGLRGLENPE